MTSNVARLIHTTTSSLVPFGSVFFISELSSNGFLVSDDVLGSSWINSANLSLSCTPFLNTSGMNARRFWMEKAGVATRRCRLCTAPSAASIPHPMSEMISRRDCHGFS
jgi:hypothetical protein